MGKVRAIQEAFRVLRPAGKAIFETIDGEAGPGSQAKNPNFPIFTFVVRPRVELTMYAHTRESLEHLCSLARLSDYRTYYRRFDKRKKLLLEIRK